MSPDYEKKLEERIHQELVKVQERVAPDALVASVLAAIKAREARPWWRRPIPEWPRNNQFVFVAVAMALVITGVFGLVQVWPHAALEALPEQAAAAAQPIQPVFSVMEALGRAGALMLRSISQPWLIGMAVAFFFAYLSCIGMGMAWYRITFQKGIARA